MLNKVLKARILLSTAAFCDEMKVNNSHCISVTEDLAKEICNSTVLNDNSKIMVYYHPEFIHELVLNKKYNPNNIWFVTDHPKRKSYAIEICKIPNKNILCVNNKEDVLKGIIRIMEKKASLKFDFIIGNPPYQKGKDKKFYQKFIAKSLKCLTENGELIFINPATFFNKDANKLLDVSPELIVFKNSSEAFQGQIKTTDICYWKYKNTKDDNHKVLIQDKSNDINNLEISWPISNDLPALGYENQRKAYKDKKINEILEKLCKIKSKAGEGQNEFVDHKTQTHIYEVYLSSKKDRQSLWSQKKPKDFENTKLIVAHIIECKDVDNYTEISSNKGVGRYSRYFLGNEIELLNIIEYLKSDAYKFVDKFKRKGRYAEISIPENDWSKPFCLESILNKDEIEVLKKHLV